MGDTKVVGCLGHADCEIVELKVFDVMRKEIS